MQINFFSWFLNLQSRPEGRVTLGEGRVPDCNEDTEIIKSGFLKIPRYVGSFSTVANSTHSLLARRSVEKQHEIARLT